MGIVGGESGRPRGTTLWVFPILSGRGSGVCTQLWTRRTPPCGGGVVAVQLSVLPSDRTPATAPLNLPSLVTYEGQERLDPLWGTAPHRISHNTAMRMAPAALRFSQLLYVSGPAVSREAAERFRVVAYEESEETLFVAARHRNGATWVSEPPRALLECLRCEDNVPDGDQAAALVVHRAYAGPAQVVIKLAEQLGWEKPLRRLASIAARIHNHEWLELPPDQRPLLDVPAAPSTAEWVALMPYSHEWVTGEPLRDHKYRVLWWEHPDSFLDYLIW